MTSNGQAFLVQANCAAHFDDPTQSMIEGLARRQNHVLTPGKPEARLRHDGLPMRRKTLHFAA
jgi:hypothetical protein